MMSALEREIIEKFHQLQPAAKQRVRALIDQDTASVAFDYEGWFRTVENLRQQIHFNQGEQLDVIGMLRDIRDGEDE